MATNIYIGNLSFDVTAEDVRDLFGAYGTVASINLITDRDTGRPRGFGFVEMGSSQDAATAIAALHGTDMHGRTLTVNAARPRPSRSNGGRAGASGRDRRG